MILETVLATGPVDDPNGRFQQWGQCDSWSCMGCHKGKLLFNSHPIFWVTSMRETSECYQDCRLLSTGRGSWFSTLHSGTFLHRWWFHETYSRHIFVWEEPPNWQHKTMLHPFSVPPKFTLWSGCRGGGTELAHFHWWCAWYIPTLTPYVFLHLCSSRCSLVLFHLSKFYLFFIFFLFKKLFLSFFT